MGFFTAKQYERSAYCYSISGIYKKRQIVEFPVAEFHEYKTPTELALMCVSAALSSFIDEVGVINYDTKLVLNVSTKDFYALKAIQSVCKRLQVSIETNRAVVDFYTKHEPLHQLVLTNAIRLFDQDVNIKYAIRKQDDKLKAAKASFTKSIRWVLGAQPMSTVDNVIDLNEMRSKKDGL